MELDPEVDAAYPAAGSARSASRTTDGREFAGRVDEPKGDPGNTLSRAEIAAKAIELATYRGAATQREMTRVLETLWHITDVPVVDRLLEAP